jgi:hypothetical protein
MLDISFLLPKKKKEKMKTMKSFKGHNNTSISFCSNGARGDCKLSVEHWAHKRIGYQIFGRKSYHFCHASREQDFWGVCGMIKYSVNGKKIVQGEGRKKVAFFNILGSENKLRLGRKLVLRLGCRLRLGLRVGCRLVLRLGLTQG